MVNITDVKQILQFAIDAEIKVFLDGGWGVDALLGYQSRAHNDIDIFVEKNDYQNFIEIMKANGFYEIKRMSGIHLAIPVFSKGYRPKQGKVVP